MNKSILFSFLKSISTFIFAVVLVKILGNWTSFPDTVYPKLQSFIGQILYAFSSKFSFSIGDVFYSFLALLGLLFLIVISYLIYKKKFAQLRKNLNALIYFLAGFYLFFHLVWGFNYYKTPIKESYDIELDSLVELKILAEVYFLKTMAYRSQVNEDENGVFKMELNENELKEIMWENSHFISSKYPEIKFIKPVKPNLKTSLYSEVFSHLGVSGYYNPFTNEGQFNTKMPDSSLLFTQLHETAHQWGFATEDEANFVGYLMGCEAEQVDLLYVSHFKAMRSILNRIFWYDPLFVKDYVENRYTAGMRRDRDYELEIIEKYTGKTDEAFSLMNEAFLKLNNQEGLESYGRFVELLVGFNRKYSD